MDVCSTDASASLADFTTTSGAFDPSTLSTDGTRSFVVLGARNALPCRADHQVHSSVLRAVAVGLPLFKLESQAATLGQGAIAVLFLGEHMLSGSTDGHSPSMQVVGATVLSAELGPDLSVKTGDREFGASLATIGSLPSYSKNATTDGWFQSGSRHFMAVGAP